MPIRKNRTAKNILEIALLAGILLVGAFFRFYGIDWDQNFHLHPDERFLTMVETSLTPVASLSEFFDTAKSSLNPHNVLDANGNSIYPLFVYGTFPLFLVRYIAEWLGMAGYHEVNIIGRYLSGIADLGTILAVFLVSKELFKSKSLPYLAALFYACAILPIQISHFFIVDNYATLFSTWAIFFAIRLQKLDDEKFLASNQESTKLLTQNWKGFGLYALFGIALGLAAASKINTLVIAFLLPGALILKDFRGLKNISAAKWKLRLRNLVCAGLISFFVFRIFQPYAFTGPGFLGMIPNPRWIANLRELSFISSGESNYPPSIQWARRSFWFPLKNLVFWGLGLPMGLLAAGGLLTMACELFSGGKREFVLLWIFTILYLIWQALRWNPTMRYFLILYPVLAVFAAWMIGYIIKILGGLKRKKTWVLIVGALILAFITSTILAPIAFLNIYKQPMTRIAASEWIYRHIPGAINLQLVNQNDEFIQPLNYPNISRLESGETIQLRFLPQMNGKITSIRFDHIINTANPESTSSINIVITTSRGEVLASQNLEGMFPRGDDPLGEPQEIILDTPIEVTKVQNYQVDLTAVTLNHDLQISGNITMEIETAELNFSQPIFEATNILKFSTGYEKDFKPIESSQLTGVEIFRWLDLGNGLSTEMKIELIDAETGGHMVSQIFSVSSGESKDFRGRPVSLKFDQPVEVDQAKRYLIRFTILNENAKVALNGSKAVKETDWDDALPLYMYGYDPNNTFEGVYASDLNFQIYWDDDRSKLERFLEGFDQADYFIISSNRQWGSVTQIPERYPLTLYFYNHLIGCQADDIQWCYRVGEPGMFDGQLGFDLIKTFQINPSIFGVEVNSQFAEEAFTVYDHPKVMIFEKQNDFDFASVKNKLLTVDLNQVINLSIKDSEQRPGLLNLETSHLLEQKSGGTWTDLFNSQSLLNNNQILTAAYWYFFILLLGWISYPMTRAGFSGLKDKGFAIAKITGLILWAFLTWLGSSSGIPFIRAFITIMLFGIFAFNVLLFLKNKEEILYEIKHQRRYLITAELFSLGLFIFFLCIRLGNPDLWHPYKGGEKPMDFAYLNAVIKSVRFPPYDPWYAGGYINYYYFGFILSGIIVKFLGIIPSIAYNLIFPTFFSFTGLAAFSLGWNLERGNHEPDTEDDGSHNKTAYLLGLTSALFVLLIGNLGTVAMFFQGIFKLGMANTVSSGVGIIDKFAYFINGIARFFQGENFSYYPGDWYWIPSRAIPGTVITEFPYFTFLYGDPHAHLFAYPLTLVVLCWSLSVVLEKIRWGRPLNWVWKIILGALLIGVLRPTNTWDYPVYLAIGCVSLFYASFTQVEVPEKIFPRLNISIRRIVLSVIPVIALALLSFFLFRLFDRWYGQAYSSIELWQGDRTPLWAYFIHWGFFLFIMISWFCFRAWNWAKSTPLSTIKPYYVHRNKFFLGLAVLLCVITALVIWGIEISLITLPLALIFLGILLFSKNEKDSYRFSIFLVLTGLALTMVVEVIALKGDIGRMNTVFKFYLQSWTLLSISSAFLLINLLNSKREKIFNLPTGWKALFGLFLASVLLFPLAASIDKINDRMNDITPLTLDGMDYMKYSTYSENGVLMDLSQDYHAIRWMQENISGTPVIVEANVPEYRWGSRFSIYTGLPSVIGWNWHQRQQRAINPGEWVFDRVNDVYDFYSTSEIENAKSFINRYGVEYIILGQLEKAVYPVEGLMKFEDYSGELWDIIYESVDTKIFKVRG